MCEVHKSSAERERIEGRSSGLLVAKCLTDCSIVEVPTQGRNFIGEYLNGVMDSFGQVGYEASIEKTDGRVYHLRVNRRLQNA